jgi:hypothetical protein
VPFYDLLSKFSPLATARGDGGESMGDALKIECGRKYRRLDHLLDF